MAAAVPFRNSVTSPLWANNHGPDVNGAVLLSSIGRKVDAARSAARTAGERMVPASEKKLRSAQMGTARR